ncbi:hypothetical protein O0L34_g9623 [Tuta absoluta]|nr:hypothetical protein O0L34_g9623 [Tuta absoluta]
MSTQQRFHEFMCLVKGAGGGRRTAANEYPSESHQLCRAYRRAPCVGRALPARLVLPPATADGHFRVIFPQAIFQTTINAACPRLVPLFKNIQKVNARPELNLEA